jgi:hypothetical protein
MAASLSSIFDVARAHAALPGRDADALRRIFRITSGSAACHVSADLAARYSLPTTPAASAGAGARVNEQRIVSVSNRVTLEQAWFNTARTKKPQTFSAPAAKAAVLDPTDGGKRCDFCDWARMTAADPGGCCFLLVFVCV